MDALTQDSSPIIPDGLPAERRRFALLAIFTALAMACLDNAVANIALPAIATDLHTSPADVVWVVNVYQIVMVATMLPLAALGEVVGLQRVYLVGLILFTAASLACACAWSLPTLLAARALQGLGASAIMSVNSALVRFIYPKRLLGHGYGMTTLVVSIAYSIGPTVGSAVLSVGPWPWLFGINVPFGIAAVLVGLKTLPKTPKASHGFDIASALLATGCLGLTIVALGSAAHHGELIAVSVELIGALAFGAVLMRWQADHPAPMLSIDLFRRPMFTLSAATALFTFVAQGLAFVALPFYLEHTLGLTAVITGLLITPWPVMVGVMAPLVGRLSNRADAGLLCGIGLAILTAGLISLALLPDNPSAANIVWRMSVCGFGFGFFQSPNVKALMSSAPPDRSGGASGIAATSRLMGQTIGAALTALCFTLSGVYGTTLALSLGAAFAAIAAALSFLRQTGKVAADRESLNL